MVALNEYQRVRRYLDQTRLRHRWQVVRFFNGALIVRCSHRWEITAMVCAQVRDAADWRTWPPRANHDVRRTPAADQRPTGTAPYSERGDVE